MVLTMPKMTPMPADAKNMRQKRQTACRNIIPPLTDAISGRDSSNTVLYQSHHITPPLTDAISGRDSSNTVLYQSHHITPPLTDAISARDSSNTVLYQSLYLSTPDISYLADAIFIKCQTTVSNQQKNV